MDIYLVLSELLSGFLFSVGPLLNLLEDEKWANPRFRQIGDILVQAATVYPPGSGYQSFRAATNHPESGYQSSRAATSRPERVPVIQSGYQSSRERLPVVQSGYQSSRERLSVIQSGYQSSRAGTSHPESGYQSSRAATSRPDQSGRLATPSCEEWTPNRLYDIMGSLLRTAENLSLMCRLEGAIQNSCTRGQGGNHCPGPPTTPRAHPPPVCGAGVEL